MTRRSNVLFFAFGLSVMPSVAFAEGPSEADQDACTPDVFRLCQDYIPNVDPIVACLKSKRVQLSPACHQVMFSAPTKPERVRKARHHRAPAAREH